VIARLQIKSAGGSQKIGQLSGGNQQKAVFGREMISDPSFYIIEAPTVGVDVKAAVELHNEIFKMAGRGSAILLATDDLEEAIRISDRILVMLRGRIVAEIASRDATREGLVAAMGAA
jgi:ABC-type sugar transport system ATPase subunit